MLMLDWATRLSGGRHVFCGNCQSIASSNIDNCDGLKLTFPSFAAGQTKRPRSSHHVNRHAPCITHQIILGSSPRRPRHKQVTRTRILSQYLFSLRRQRVETAAHVRHPDSHPHPSIAWHRNHAISPCTRPRMAENAAGPSTRISRPSDKVVSTRWADIAELGWQVFGVDSPDPGWGFRPYSGNVPSIEDQDELGYRPATDLS